EREVLAAERLQERRQGARVLADGLHHQRVRQEVRAVPDRDRAEDLDGEKGGSANRDGANQLAPQQEREADEPAQEEALVARDRQKSGERAESQRAPPLGPGLLSGRAEDERRRRGERDREQQVEDVLHAEDHHPRQRKRDDEPGERRAAQEGRGAEAAERG